MSHKVEVIAEIGVNWQGDMGLAARMIRTAKDCGADTAKFQVYDPRTTLDPDDLAIKPWWDLILQTQLSFEQVRMLKVLCDDMEIGFLASAFDVERVGWLRHLGVERYKIAARSSRDRVLAAAIGATGKQVLLSVSERYGLDWPTPIEALTPPPEVMRLYCVSEYPTPLRHLALEGLMFDDNFDGFSDHTRGITASVVAMSLGARIVEKHFTMDQSLPGPDHICSATPDELYRLCKMRDDVDQILYKESE